MTTTRKHEVMLPLVENGKPEYSVKAPPTHSARLRLWRFSPIMVSFFIGAAGGTYFQPPILNSFLETVGRKPGASTSQPRLVSGDSRDSGEVGSTVQRMDVVALGRVLPSGGILALAAPYGAGDARVARMLVSEGDRVEAGQVIAELDNLPQLLAVQTSAKSTLVAQQASLEQVRALVLANLADARANRARAEAARVLANQELARVTKLALHNLSTQVQLQQAQSTAAQAVAEIDRTTALLKRFAGAEGDTQPDILLASRNVDLGYANLARASDDLAAARVIAPRAGTVLAIRARVGEKPTDAGILTLGDVDRMTAELHVYQTDIGKVALGQLVNLTAQALSTPLTGNVTTIAQIVERQSVMASDPAANADARVVRVTIALDAPSSALARSYTNLEVVGRIRVGQL
ncbi:HlyD family efflux transporter periplasmic adaptor subunit [Agrobacterium vitis]|uniref:HlyD family efflux transporter periplasmic adaptor subunit n=1 Tax=Rhizobium/Agrobacterium group TaxID=227290 RepID=UPI0012E84EB8|nr:MULTISPECIES: HlyD family efflux transporter periplasmic adaptor subunit [Rhizobium/Agrobacterium group]MCF1464957.1 HlyD family efflux transporter periplasmic adaptor subunit [Allorhizobium ampelinum]MCM2471247.1 HlyD family efflux transporter periplasmic adaptor subunit [Agrobacterium vitis]MVA52783.1 HlyD family efflux transporter periplasmic adaptor subunit [Agrobacterium vitis]